MQALVPRCLVQIHGCGAECRGTHLSWAPAGIILRTPEYCVVHHITKEHDGRPRHLPAQVDRLFDWTTHTDAPIQDSFAGQKPHVQTEFRQRYDESKLNLNEQVGPGAALPAGCGRGPLPGSPFHIGTRDLQSFPGLPRRASHARPASYGLWET